MYQSDFYVLLFRNQDQAIVNNISGKITEQVQYYIEKVFDQYGVVLVSLMIGFLFAWYGKRYLSDHRYLKQINLRLDERDRQIRTLNSIVLERMNKIEVEKKDKSFFSKLKKIFRNPEKEIK